ncbi:polysaccharide deacetylase family protein [Pontibacillus marinus]|uniref:NodB homology domain-containing protein n=1 Tax=Pontibacillus marinus BH030004 = DSM 16465 TaxID=1385511 RepID=A0A0A5FXP8_9BACI|nr:hypothetical protein [Pontibacillus marinus]KGX84564.1 hypothetical protein N783_16635 [Pontibacillus marinus BH030004 = DSM 16465]
MNQIAKIGVYIDDRLSKRYWEYGQNVFALFLHEVLGRLRVPYQTIKDIDEVKTNDFDIVIAGFSPETKDEGEKILQYMTDGGTVLALANLNQLAPRLGYKTGKEINEGYAQYDHEKYTKLRFLNASPWNSIHNNGDYVHKGVVYEKGTQPSFNTPLFQQLPIGEGKFHRCSVDIMKTIVNLQQGKEPLFHDGVPAPDNSAEIVDNVLKVDDMYAMDWDEDRKTTETNQSYFAYPYADLWREVLFNYLINLALDKDLTVPFVGYWPDQVKSVALMSHDSDYNQDEHAETTLDLLNETGIKSTWCMILPGYSKEIYNRVKEEGHELAFHYNAVHVDEGVWSREAFHEQFTEIKENIGQIPILSNKNHLTRYEGWGELFEWCEETGIQSDQTYGPSKKGNLGFLFGTCHPYFPIAWGTDRNRMYDVLEAVFLTPDLETGKWGDTSIINPILDEVMNVQGVAHFLFHQIHIHRNSKVRNAFREFVSKAKSRGFTFWTGKELNEWERLKRTVFINEINDLNHIQYKANEGIKNFIVYVPTKYTENKDESVFGISCRKIVCQPDEVKKDEVNI